jgi:hypothetical protein
MRPDPRGYSGLGSDTGPAKILHSFTPDPFLFSAENPSLPPTPDGEQKIIIVGVGTDPGDARVERREKKRGGWWLRRVSGGEGGGASPASDTSPSSGASPAGGCRSGEAAARPLPRPLRPRRRRTAGRRSGGDAHQVCGGAVFSPSAFGGHLLTGDCILALLFSSFPTRVLCLLPGIRC